MRRRIDLIRWGAIGAMFGGAVYIVGGGVLSPRRSAEGTPPGTSKTPFGIWWSLSARWPSSWAWRDSTSTYDDRLASAGSGQRASAC